VGQPLEITAESAASLESAGVKFIVKYQQRNAAGDRSMHRSESNPDAWKIATQSNRRPQRSGDAC
jgi:hypothetical protein